MKKVDRLNLIHHQMLRRQRFNEDSWDQSSLGFASSLLKKIGKKVWDKTQNLRFRLRKKVKQKVLKLYTTTWTRVKGKLSKMEIESLSGEELSAISKFWGGRVPPEAVREAIRDTKVILFVTLAAQRASWFLLRYLDKIAKNKTHPFRNQAQQSLLDYKNGVSAFLNPSAGLLASSSGRSLLGLSSSYAPLNALLAVLISANNFGVLFPDLVIDLVWSILPGYDQQFKKNLTLELQATEDYVRGLFQESVTSKEENNEDLISMAEMQEIQHSRNALRKLRPSLRKLVEQSLCKNVHTFCKNLMEGLGDDATDGVTSGLPQDIGLPEDQELPQPQQSQKAQAQPAQPNPQEEEELSPESLLRGSLGNIARIQESVEYAKYKRLFLRSTRYKTVELYFFIKILLDRGLMNYEGAFTDLRKFNLFMLQTNMGMLQDEYQKAKEEWASRHNK